MKTIKTTVTGAQIKALITNPELLTSAEFTLATGLFGATTGDVVYLSTVGFNTYEGDYNITFTIAPSDPSYLNVGITVGNVGAKQAGTSLIEGNLVCSINQYGEGLTLADISDTLNFDLYLTGGILEEFIL